jgi:hypothetical protein
MIRKRIVLIFLALATLSCTREAQRSQPTGPGQTPPRSFSGVWETEYSVASCSSGRPWHCPAAGSVAHLTLRLEDSGDSISGFIVDQRGQSPVSGRTAGSTASLQGRTLPGHSDEPVIEVRDMLLTLRSDSTLVGGFELHSTDSLLFMVVRGEIFRTTSHSSLPDISDYSGTWRGGYVVQRCVRNSSNPCGGRDSEGLFETLELVIDDERKAITLGTLPALMLTGTVGSAGIDLRSEEGPIGNERLTIARLSAARNRVGQLHGNLTYIVKRPGIGQEMDIRTVELEFVNVVQVR